MVGFKLQLLLIVTLFGYLKPQMQDTGLLFCGTCTQALTNFDGCANQINPIVPQNITVITGKGSCPPGAIDNFFNQLEEDVYEDVYPCLNNPTVQQACSN